MALCVTGDSSYSLTLTGRRQLIRPSFGVISDPISPVADIRSGRFAFRIERWGSPCQLGRMARTINPDTKLGTHRSFLREGPLILLFSPLTPISAESVHLVSATVQPSISTIRWKSLNHLISSCYPPV